MSALRSAANVRNRPIADLGLPACSTEPDNAWSVHGTRALPLCSPGRWSDSGHRDSKICRRKGAYWIRVLVHRVEIHTTSDGVRTFTGRVEFSWLEGARGRTGDPGEERRSRRRGCLLRTLRRQRPLTTRRRSSAFDPLRALVIGNQTYNVG